MNLAEIKEDFPSAEKAKYEPDPECTSCGGSGIMPPRILPSGKAYPEHPCMCIFVNNNMVRLLFKDFCKKQVAEMQER